MLNTSFTRKRKHTNYQYDHCDRYDRLQYIGSGSYGSIYEILNTNIVLKEHRMFTPDTCTNWKHEFDTQYTIHTACNTLLQPYSTAIVKPYLFTYARRDDSNCLIRQETMENAQSCFFTMVRVPGFASSRTPKCFIRKLNKVIKPEIPLRPTLIPPYLNLGSVQYLDGHISLDMVNGTTCIEFPNEAYNYCHVNGVALTLIKNMFISFFIIAESGFIPRDIEFVFNGSCAKHYISILDFNEVKRLEERKHNRSDYNIHVDLANVYIDLCGLRRSNTLNPEAPYDNPTPQWKFLCSPIVSPYAFFECVESVRKLGFQTFNIDAVIAEILAYIEKHIILSIFSEWTPNRAEFSHSHAHSHSHSHIYTEFDKHLQIYYISKYVESLQLRKINVIINPEWTYIECLKYLQSLNVAGEEKETDEEWNVLWAVPDPYPDPRPDPDPKRNNNMKIKRRRYSVRKHQTAAKGQTDATDP